MIPLVFFKFLWEFCASGLADGSSLDPEWQQVPSSIQDSSQYSIIIIINSVCFLQAVSIGFHWSLSASKSPLISRIRLCILSDFSSAVI